LLRIGGLAPFCMGLGDFFSLQESAASARSAPRLGRAKACILLYLYGSPSQHDTFDPKPEAAVEIRGEMQAIATRTPGLHICDGLPQVAAIADRLTVVRSLTHPYPLHGTAYALSGSPAVDTAIEAQPRDPRHWPFIGSTVDYLAERPAGSREPAVPRNVALPCLLGSRANYPPLAGPYATFLGASYDPVWTDFAEQGVKPTPKVSSSDSRHHFDPNAGIRPEARIGLAGDSPQQSPAGQADTGRPRRLLAQFDAAQPWLADNPRIRAYDRQQQRAFSLLASGRFREALDIAREPPKSRHRYGMTLFGQATLAARRLIEAGCTFVTVFWDAWGDNNAAWDTHYLHFPRMKEILLPGFDAAFSALILDLEARGLLDETLILCFSEHGRTAKIDNVAGGGRNHWSQVYSAVFAGGGVAAGRVVGKSDKSGAAVVDRPVSPKNILATAYHLLGIDPHTTIPDRTGRPLPLVAEGAVVQEMLA
jgi:hypothetical protein